MGDKSNIGKGAPSPLGGIASALAGKHANKETGKTDAGKTVTGYGSTKERANADYQRKGGKT
jgi:hypothetical protein